MHTCIRIPQIITQVLGQRLHCRLAGIVCCIAGRVCDALFGPRDHDSRGPRAFPGFERWDKGIEAIDHAKQIRGEDLKK